MKNFLNLDNLQRFAVTYNHTNYKLNKTITTKDANGMILSNWIKNTRSTLKDIRITDMSGTITNCCNLFSQAQNLISIDLTNFNTSKVTDMSKMFYCRNLTGISNFNTNNVTNMVYMFNSCYNLTGGNFNFTTVSKVTNMARMFSGCNNLNQNALNSIYNMCINATSVSQKKLSNSSPYSPLYDTKFNNSYIPSSFKTRLTAAGWTY